MSTLVELSPSVKVIERKIGDYTVRIYNSAELITFHSIGQRIKVYKALVQTVLNSEEKDLMGYYEQLTPEQVKEQFNIIKRNIKS